MSWKYDRGTGWAWMLFVLPVLVFLMILNGCSKVNKPQKEFDVQYLDYFDTITSFTVYTESEEQFREYAEVFRSRLEYYHQMFDIYRNYEGISNIKTINDNAGIAPVKVDREIVEMLKFAVKTYERAEGRVNVAMGSVLSVWHDYRENSLADPNKAQIPDMQQLLKAAEHADIRQIQIDERNSTVYLPDSSMSLDVGAVAKGYAVQRIVGQLREKGVVSALISVGGNVQTIGVRGDGNPWRVGIQNPDITGSQPYLYALSLKDMALVTSGTYQRYYLVDGVPYHHIINPDTLMPGREYESVTILCRDGGQADALSTAVFNMTLEKGQALIESLEDTEAFWVFPDGSQTFSSGFYDYVIDGG